MKDNCPVCMKTFTAHTWSTLVICMIKAREEHSRLVKEAIDTGMIRE